MSTVIFLLSWEGIDEFEKGKGSVNDAELILWIFFIDHSLAFFSYKVVFWHLKVILHIS